MADSSDVGDLQFEKSHEFGLEPRLRMIAMRVSGRGVTEPARRVLRSARESPSHSFSDIRLARVCSTIFSKSVSSSCSCVGVLMEASLNTCDVTESSVDGPMRPYEAKQQSPRLAHTTIHKRGQRLSYPFFARSVLMLTVDVPGGGPGGDMRQTEAVPHDRLQPSPLAYSSWRFGFLDPQPGAATSRSAERLSPQAFQAG